VYNCAGLTQPTRPARPSNEDWERRKFGGVGSFGPGKVMGGADVKDFAFRGFRFLVGAEAKRTVPDDEDALPLREWVDDLDAATGVCAEVGVTVLGGHDLW
jgi:hypothetical protein